MEGKQPANSAFKRPALTIARWLPANTERSMHVTSSWLCFIVFFGSTSVGRMGAQANQIGMSYRHRFRADSGFRPRGSQL